MTWVKIPQSFCELQLIDIEKERIITIKERDSATWAGDKYCVEVHKMFSDEDNPWWTFFDNKKSALDFVSSLVEEK